MEQQQSFTPAPRQQNLLIPIAILLGFGMIAAAIFFSGSRTNSAAVSDTAPTEQQPVAGDLSNINPLTEDDHVLGDPNASIVLIEYSDFDCPFCKSFHDTMNRIIDEYGVESDVSWVYRHFPIASRHPNATRVAEASECVAELGGNDAFWAFSDLVFGERDTNEPTNIVRLEEFAETAGVDGAAFTTCLDSGRHTDAVQEDLDNAMAIGANGTPFTVVMVGDQLGTINGAQPYSVVKGVIDNLLNQLEASN
jgi:protein-disulfide isomerase